MNTKSAVVLTRPPTVAVLADMTLRADGVLQMVGWVRDRRPECLPEVTDARDYFDAEALSSPDGFGLLEAMSLFPHDGFEGPDQRPLTGNELLVELAGRKCYDSFGLKAGRKTNAEYIANTQQGEIPHASIMYHAKMTFFIGGVSRRVSHELIRHYVGADRDEEGSPSQESTRYVEHAGRYIAHPAILNDAQELAHFSEAVEGNYQSYLNYIERRFAEHGGDPKGLERKRIYESASPYLAHSCETSFIWTTNPIAVAKLFRERLNEAADLEFARLAEVWRDVCVERWPNLFQSWLR